MKFFNLPAASVAHFMLCRSHLHIRLTFLLRERPKFYRLFEGCIAYLSFFNVAYYLSNIDILDFSVTGVYLVDCVSLFDTKDVRHIRFASA